MSATHRSSYSASLPVKDRLRWRRVVTPEGAVIHLRLADASERAAALLIDLVIMFIVMMIAFFALFALGTRSESWNSISLVISYLFFFLLRSFYFTAFEMGRRAATPGKRIMKLRVVAREGRQLTANAIFARNVMRELELFLPLSVLLSGPGSDGVSALLTLCLTLWLAVFMLLPLMNRDKLRAGDLVAGTWVIRNPDLDLGEDVSLEESRQSHGFRFSDAQLSTYGEHELQVLEDVLRVGSPDVQKAVAERIRQRINWSAQPDETDRVFLEAFYRDLRKTLETRMLFGNRKRDKYDTRS